MARKLQIRRGQKANIPTLAEGELGFALDEKKLYIGHTDGNVDLTGACDSVGVKQYSTDGNNTLLGEKFNRAIDASGNSSHAEGRDTTASGNYSHAEGASTTASGPYSHAEGSGTIARGSVSHAQGRYNIEDTENKYAHIVGNGTKTTRSNAHTLDWSGNTWYQGEVRVGGDDYDSGKKLLTASDDTLTTTNKTIVGAINEINAKPSSSLTLGETSTTAYRGDRGAVAYTHSQSTHAPTNAQKNSLITKAEIEAKLTGVISSHSHNTTFNGGWELIEDSGVISYANLATGKNFSTTTLSKEYTQIKLELRCVGLGQPFGETSKLWLDSTEIYVSNTYADIKNSNRVIVLNRCDELSNRDSTHKSFNSGMYNATSEINTLNFGSAVTHKFKGSNTFNKGTAQLLIYGRL